MSDIQPENPQSAQEWVNQGIKQVEAGDNEAALISFIKALELEPKNIDAWFKRCDTLKKLDRTEEAISCYQSGLTIARESKNSWNEAAAQYNLGICYKSLNRQPDAIQAYAEAYRLFRQINNEQWSGEAWKLLNQFAESYMTEKQYAEAIQIYQKQRNILQEFNDHKALGWVLQNLGKAQYYSQDYEGAIASHTLMLEIARFLADKNMESLAVAWLGCDRREAKQLDFAVYYFNQRLTLAKSANDTAAQKETLGWLVTVTKQLGKDTAMPCPYMMEQIDLFRQLGETEQERSTCYDLGSWQFDLKQYQEAIDNFVLAAILGEKVAKANAYFMLGQCYRMLEKQQEAIENYQKAADLYIEQDNQEWAAKSLNYLWEIYKSLKDYEKAIDCQQQRLKLMQEMGDRDNQQNALYRLGCLCEDNQQYSQAIEYLTSALTLANELKQQGNVANAHYMLGSTYEKLEQLDEAIVHYREAERLYTETKNQQWEENSRTQLKKLEDKQKEAEKQQDLEREQMTTETKTENIQDFLDVNNPIFWVNRGYEFLMKNDYQAALDDFNYAINLDSSIVDAWIYKGIAFFMLNEINNAFYSFDNALILDPNNNDIWIVINILLIEKNNLKQPKNAVIVYQFLLKFNPNNLNAWYNCGYALLELRQNENAIKCFDCAIEINPNLSDAWAYRGAALGRLNRYDESMESLNRAIKIDPDNHHAWCSKSFILLKLEQYQEAMAASDRALVLDPNCPSALSHRGTILANGFQKYNEALENFNQALSYDVNNIGHWKNRGVVLLKLEKFEAALESFEKVLTLNLHENDIWDYISSNLKIKIISNTQYEEAIIRLYRILLNFNCQNLNCWYKCGDLLRELKRYEDAITCFDRAIDINPSSFEAWHNKGLAWFEFGRAGFRSVAQKELAEALNCLNRAVEINPNSDEAWYNRGNVLWHRGRDQEAIESFDRAIELNSNYPMAWKMKSLALNGLGKAHEALASMDRALELSNYQLVDAWVDRGSTLLSLGREKEAVQNYDDALKLVKPEDQEIFGNIFPYKAICIRLLYQKADVLYHVGLATPDHLLYWEDARKIYRQVLELQESQEKSVSIFQNLIIICRALGEANEAQELLREGTEQLQRQLENIPSPRKKILTARLYASFNQLRVDQLIEQGKAIKALELAEERKNTCLSWLRHGWSDTVPSPKYQDIQQLLNPHTAAIYWHLSPAAITTFILKHNQPLVTLVSRYDRPPSVFSNETAPDDATYADAARKLYRLEQWIAIWKKDYQNQKQHWRDEMPNRLATLGILLDIPEIVTYLSGIDNLILFPHRDLHLLPLEALFPQKFTITRLPSAQIGLEKSLEMRFRNSSPESPCLLTVENPRNDLPFSSIEAGVIKQLYPPLCYLPEAQATSSNVMTALQAEARGAIFHFTGHGQHEFAEPLESALLLAGTDRLTLSDIFQLDLNSYFLVFLSACETGITGKKDLIDEFVGLASAFQAVGANHVVSTLWTVNDMSTALLTIRFYNNLKKPMPVAVALKEAQNWLRNITKEQLQEWTENLHLGKTEQRLLRMTFSKIEAGTKPFASPYYWAGFCAIGQ